jgi:hypothetical protein
MNATHVLGQFLRTLPHSAAATFLALFPIVDPFGGIPIFFTLTASWTAKDRNKTALKTGIWVFVGPKPPHQRTLPGRRRRKGKPSGQRRQSLMTMPKYDAALSTFAASAITTPIAPGSDIGGMASVRRTHTPSGIGQD